MNARFILALMIAMCGLGSVRAQDKPGGKPGDKPGAAMDPQAQGFAQWQQQMQQQMMKRFDADGDGKLSDTEKLAMQQAMAQNGWNFGVQPGGFPGEQEFVKRFDQDGDGKLDPRESMMAQQAFQKMMGHGGMRGGVRGGGGGSGYMPQPAMPVAPQGNDKTSKLSPLAKRFDKDGDGKLNDEEKAALQAEVKKKDGKDAKKEKDKPKK